MTDKEDIEHNMWEKGKDEKYDHNHLGRIERFNGTLKRLLLRSLNYRIGSDWQDHVETAVKNYNRSPHRVIRMPPNAVKPANYAEVTRNILEGAKRQKRVQNVVYQPGDFVRLKIYKPKRLRPSYTYVGGPLYDLKKERRYNGVYMISAVNRPSGRNKIGAAPTYSIIPLVAPCIGFVSFELWQCVIRVVDPICICRIRWLNRFQTHSIGSCGNRFQGRTFGKH